MEARGYQIVKTQKLCLSVNHQKTTSNQLIVKVSQGRIKNRKKIKSILRLDIIEWQFERTDRIP